MIADDLSGWQVPCLIYVGEDDEMHDAARRAAAEIPTATFLSLPGRTHFSSEVETEQVLGPIRELLRSA